MPNILRDRREELAIQAFYHGYDKSKQSTTHYRIGDAIGHVIWILGGGEKIRTVSNATAKRIQKEIEEFRTPIKPYAKPKKKKRVRL